MSCNDLTFSIFIFKSNHKYNFYLELTLLKSKFCKNSLNFIIVFRTYFEMNATHVVLYFMERDKS